MTVRARARVGVRVRVRVRARDVAYAGTEQGGVREYGHSSLVTSMTTVMTTWD